jgi:hypothetical protein
MRLGKPQSHVCDCDDAWNQDTTMGVAPGDLAGWDS